MSGLSHSILRTALAQAVASRFAKGDDEIWAYVTDFDDDTVVYSVKGETFQLGYTADGKGNVTLDDGDPVPVRRVTTFVPAPEAKGGRTFESRGLAPAGPAGPPHVEVRREPLTYEEDGPHSYFRDQVLATVRDDRAAAGRLDRHSLEMRVERDRFETRARRQLRDAGFELRVNPNTTQGQGGYFTIPLWLNQYFATARRPARVLADMIPGKFPLPHGVHSINMPRLLPTTSNVVQPQADLSATPGQTATDASVNGTVVTLAGIADTSLQLLEQSPAGAHLDWAFFQDLTEAYDAQLETQLLFGSGVGENIAGIASYVVTSTNQVVVTTASTVATAGPVAWTAIAKALALVGDNRKVPPQVVLMRTARWVWLGQQGDKQARPLITPGDAPEAGDGRPVDGIAPVGAAFGFPVYPDDAIPTTLKVTATGTPPTGGTQDAIIVCRPSDLMLFEGTPVTSVMTQVLSGTLEARLQLRNFVVGITGRYPAGVATVTGALLAKDTGF